MKKLFYTFILLAGFQFAQGQEVIEIHIQRQGEWYYLDSMDFGSVSQNFTYKLAFRVVNNGTSLSAGDSLRITTTMNNVAYAGITFPFVSAFPAGDTAALSIDFPFLLVALQSGKNTLCAEVAYVVIGGTKTTISEDAHCQPFFVTIPVNIADIDNFANVSIYPNPVRDNLKIDNLEENTTIEIYSITGQRVHTVSSVMGSTEIDMSNLSNGVYVLKMQNGKNTRTEKIQVLR